MNLFLYHSWTNSLHWIDRIDEAKSVVRFTNPTGWPIAWWEREQRYYVENVREALDAPGEWYLDRKTGLLGVLARCRARTWPRSRSVAPGAGATRERSTATGKRAGTVHDVVLRGLSFQHADWTFADKTQAGRRPVGRVPARRRPGPRGRAA